MIIPKEGIEKMAIERKSLYRQRTGPAGVSSKSGDAVFPLEPVSKETREMIRTDRLLLDELRASIREHESKLVAMRKLEAILVNRLDRYVEP